MMKPAAPATPDALSEAIERALAPYKRLFSAETIETMRAEARLQLGAHPYPAALVRALEPPVLQDSGDVVRRDGAAANEPAAAETARSRAAKKGVA